MINGSDFPIIKKLIEKFGGKVNEGQLNSAIDAKVADGTIASGEQLDSITQQPFRFICVSDIHKDEAEGVGGITSAQRMQHLVYKLEEENKLNKLDAVFILGDLSLNNKKKTNPNFPDGVKYVKENVVDKLSMPCYCLHGNHDAYTETDWKNLFGYSKNYDVVIGDFAFICFDSFGVQGELIDGIWERTFPNLTDLKSKMDYYKSTNKKVFFLSHWMGSDQGQPIPQQDIDTLTLLASYDNFIACVQGHDHSFNSSVKYGAKVLQDGSYAYDFSDKPKWGFRNFEWFNGNLKTEKYLVENDYGSYQQTKEISMKESLVGVMFERGFVPNFYNENITKQIAEFARYKSLQNTNSIETINNDIFNGDTTEMQGVTINYTNNTNSKILCDIKLVGNTTYGNVVPTFSTPCIITETDTTINIKGTIEGQVVTNEPIRKIKDSNIFDDVLKGVLTRRIKKTILNGSENWQPASSQDSSTHISFVLTMTDGNVTLSEKDITVFSDKILAMTNNDMFLLANGKEGIAYGGGSGKNNIKIKILKSRLSTQDVIGFKSFLASNNITVLYPIVPKNESVNTLNSLILNSGDNIISSTNAINKPFINLLINSSTKSKIDYLLSNSSNSSNAKEKHILNVLKGVGKTFGYIYADTFSLVDGTSVASGKSDSGGDFIITGTMCVKDFSLYNNNSIASSYDVNLGVNNHEVEVLLGDTSTDSYYEIFLSKTDTSNQYCLAYANKTGKLEFKETINGSSTSTWLDLKYTPMFSKDNVIKLKCSSNMIYVYINDIEIVSTNRRVNGSNFSIKLAKNSMNSFQSICAKIVN